MNRPLEKTGMPTFFNLVQAARKIGCRPRDLSDGFYTGRLSDLHCEYVAGRRYIRAEQITAIAAILKRRAAGK